MTVINRISPFISSNCMASALTLLVKLIELDILQEARALLGRLEYQRGNTEAALRVFDGIDIAAITPKMKISISKRTERRKFRSHWDVPLMSIHAVSLLVEAIYFKARALKDLGRFEGISTLIFSRLMCITIFCLMFGLKLPSLFVFNQGGPAGSLI